MELSKYTENMGQKAGDKKQVAIYKADWLKIKAESTLSEKPIADVVAELVKKAEEKAKQNEKP